MRLLGFASLLLILSSSVALLAVDSAAGRAYLSLGDSVSFGFITNAGFDATVSRFRQAPLTNERIKATLL